MCYVATRGVHSDLFETVIADPERTYKKIFDLKDDTEYEITIWALTAAGRGEPKVIVEVTVPSSGWRRNEAVTSGVFSVLTHLLYKMSKK